MTTTAISPLPVLLVDDEPPLLRSASLLLRAAGITPVFTLDDSRQVLSRLAADPIGVVVLDLTMPYLSGQALLEQITTQYPSVHTIVMTATHDLETAVRCMQGGAVDYLVKPVDTPRLVASVRRALELRALQPPVGSPPAPQHGESVPLHPAFAELATHNATMQALLHYVEAIARSPQPVLITGETGTGKELLARAMHRLAAPGGDFVVVQVAGLDDQGFADTLFGHTCGAFAGADRSRDGAITRAEGGTLFVDEIGDLPPVSQVKLLRLLQDGTYVPLGADHPCQSRARVVVATTRDLVPAVQAGTFRTDLYYRLRTHQIQVPPLRARQDDLPLLVTRCLMQAAAALHKAVPPVPPALYPLLSTYPFPGNIRELEAMIFDAVARHTDGPLALHTFQENIEAGHRLLATVPGVTPERAAEPLWHTASLPTVPEAGAFPRTATRQHANGHEAAPILEPRPTALAADAVRQAQDLALFRCDGDYWTVRFAGTTCLIKEACGLHYIATLLQHPQQPLHVLALTRTHARRAEATAEAQPVPPPDYSEGYTEEGSDLGDVLDPQARSAYKRRLSELHAELAEAHAFHDLGRRDALQAEWDFLTQELARAIGLGGRSRKANSPAERARVSVTRAIKNALRKIAGHHPALGQHLATTIKTGAYCSYTPDARLPIAWQS